MLRFLFLALIASASLVRAEVEPLPVPAAEPPPLVGKIVGETYVAPSGAYKIPLPVRRELGGTVTDTENVVTFQDDFNVHVSIAAFAQDATQRWELTTRGPKEYLIYFFKTFVMPDFLQFEGAKVESARYLPTVQDGTLLAYTLLPGGSMFADRVSITSHAADQLVAKRGNLVFVRNGYIFVISTELAERVLQHNTYKKTPAEEDDLLRQRLLDLLNKIEFAKPEPVLTKK
jgi:hypothetical protein